MGNNIIEKGSINVMISSPHCVDNIRNGEKKSLEVKLKDIALELYKGTNCHAIYKTVVDNDDPNYSEESEYRNSLIDYINTNNINFLIDLHGMKNNKLDLEIGTNHLININNSKILYKYICNYFKSKNYKYSIDTKFAASGKNTVSSTINRECKIPAIQIEISRAIRDDDNKLTKLIEDLKEFIIFLSNCKQADAQKFKGKLFVESVRYVGMSKMNSDHYDIYDFMNNSTNDLYSTKSFDVELINEDDTKNNALYFKGTAYNMIKDDPFFHKIPRRKIEKTLKPSLDSLDADSIYIDQETYKWIKSFNTDYACIYNPTLDTKMVLKIIEGETKEHTTIWMNYRQREILGLLPWNYYKKNDYLNLKDLFKDDETLLTYFENAYTGDDYYNTYTLRNDISIKSMSSTEDKFFDNDDDLKRAYCNKLPIFIFPAIKNIKPKKYPFDYLVGYSAAMLQVQSAKTMDQGNKIARLSPEMAKKLDINENERIIVYNENKKISLRVMISESISNFAIGLPKNVLGSLEVSKGTMVHVKRDNFFLFTKKIDYLILTLLLSFFSVYSTLTQLAGAKWWISVIIIAVIVILTTISIFTERRKNVK